MTGSVSDARPLAEAARGLSVGFANLWRMVSPGSGRSMVHYGQATTGGPRKRSIRRRMPGLCCMDRPCGRTGPYPCPGSCDADVLRASELEHAVQHADSDRHLGRLAPVRARA